MGEGWKIRWGWRVSAVVLAIGLLVLGTSTVVTQAGDRDDDHDRRNPFQQILHKLDKILDAVKGGGQEESHTLRWDTNHPSVSRFTTAFPGAVLDKNTGLVWEQAPDAAELVWTVATFSCINKNVGGTRGWRLPSVAELVSLIDPSLPAPFVPARVFTNIQSLGLYWSATTHAEDHTLAWDVGFQSGDVLNHPKANPFHAWCVRGGMNADAY